MSGTKDRLEELRKNQKSSKDGDYSAVESTNSAQFANVFQQVEVIRSWIEKIKENNSRISVVLESPQSNARKDADEFERLMANTTTIGVQITQKLKALESSLDGEDRSTEARMKRMQLASMRELFRETLLHNSQLIERYRNSKKSKLVKLAKITNTKIDEEEVQRLLDENTSPEFFIDNVLQDTRAAKQQLRDIEDRHRELLKIEGHLREIRDLFMQMAMVIEQQQESVNRIEYHANTAIEFVDRGTDDINKAEQKKKTYNKRKTYLIILLVLVLIILLVVLLK